MHLQECRARADWSGYRRRRTRRALRTTVTSSRRRVRSACRSMRTTTGKRRSMPSSVRRCRRGDGRVRSVPIPAMLRTNAPTATYRLHGARIGSFSRDKGESRSRAMVETSASTTRPQLTGHVRGGPVPAAASLALAARQIICRIQTLWVPGREAQGEGALMT